MTLILRSKNQALYAAALEILKAEKPMTLRQLYYRSISAGVLGNSQSEYQRLGKVMTRAREAGDVPRTWLVDHVRSTLKPSSWSGLADFGDTVRRAYRKDFWAHLPHHVEVFVEKDAVAGTIQPVTHEHDVALRVCRGYASVSFAGEIADEWSRITKPIFAYYLGDFDPSGFDIERDLFEKLERYSDLFCVTEAGEAESGSFVWQRLGVQSADFQTFDLIELPVKTTDKRAPGFIAQHGRRCAEIDAIPPTELRRRVRSAIEGHIDAELWEQLQETEDLERESMRALVAHLGQA